MANQNSLNAPVVFASDKGGTGQNTYTAGDTLYYASGTTLSKLPIGGANRILSSTGTAPAWVGGAPSSGNVLTYNGTNIVWAAQSGGTGAPSFTYFLRMSFPAGAASGTPTITGGGGVSNICFATFTGDTVHSNPTSNPLYGLLRGTTTPPSANATLLFCFRSNIIFNTGGGGVPTINYGVSTNAVSFSNTQWDSQGATYIQMCLTSAGNPYTGNVDIPILVSTLANGSNTQLNISMRNNISSGECYITSYEKYMKVLYYPYGFAASS